MNNIQFALYNPNSDCVEVNVGINSVLIIRCRDFNSRVTFDEPEDIVYLYQLAQDNPLTYAKFALQKDGLQGYVDAMKWFNY